MKTLSLTNSTTYEIDEEEFRAVLEAINSGVKYIIIQGDYLMVSCIVGMQESERMLEAGHRKNGDHQCAFGQWHAKYDKCFGHDAMELGANSVGNILEAGDKGLLGA